MKTIVNFLIVMLFCSFNLMSQIDTLSYDRTTKFKFERFTGSRAKTLRQGTLITINIDSLGTKKQFHGNLYQANNNELTINCDWKSKNIDTYYYHLSESTQFAEKKIISIPYSSISSISYGADIPAIPAIFTYTSLVSGLIIAPLVSINDKYPNNFNSQRYQKIVLSSLIGTGIGLIATWIAIGGKNKYKLKAKLI